MQKLFLPILLTFIGSQGFSQYYFSLAPSLTNTAGTIADKSNVVVEIGKQWEVFSMGLDIGKTTLSKVTGRDTSIYFELRPSLNVFQEGKFTSTFTTGIGYIFRAKENLLTELTYGIEYSFSTKTHFNVFFGQYYYSGKISASNVSFFGISAMFYLKPNQPESLIKHK